MTRRGVQRTEKLVVPERASKASCIKAISWAMGKNEDMKEERHSQWRVQ